MIKLSRSINAWNTPDFKTALKNEIESLEAVALPLQDGLSQSSHVSEEDFSVIILNVMEQSNVIRVKAGIFYSGIIAGCSCADDPTPVDRITEYCEVLFDIDKQTAETEIKLLPS